MIFVSDLMKQAVKIKTYYEKPQRKINVLSIVHVLLFKKE
jgi:hypothetical protein